LELDKPCQASQSDRSYLFMMIVPSLGKVVCCKCLDESRAFYTMVDYKIFYELGSGDQVKLIFFCV
jgi:hypothetical protein